MSPLQTTTQLGLRVLSVSRVARGKRVGFETLGSLVQCSIINTSEISSTHNLNCFFLGPIISSVAALYTQPFPSQAVLCSENTIIDRLTCLRHAGRNLSLKDKNLSNPHFGMFSFPQSWDSCKTAPCQIVPWCVCQVLVNIQDGCYKVSQITEVDEITAAFLRILLFGIISSAIWSTFILQN